MMIIILRLLSLKSASKPLRQALIVAAALSLLSLEVYAELSPTTATNSSPQAKAEPLEADDTSSSTPTTDVDTELDEEPPAEIIETLPEAENIDLSQPVIVENKLNIEPKVKPSTEPSPPSKTAAQTPTAPEKTKKSGSDNTASKASTENQKENAADKLIPVDKTKIVSAKKTAEEAQEAPWVFLDTVIPRGTTTRLSWSPDQSFEGIATPTPVLIARGVKPGPRLCLTAALHGDELNGIEVVRRVMYNIDATELTGTVIGVPIVNLQGFRRSSRYLTDRRDLNRFFPGTRDGSSASRIAYSFFERIIQHCDLLVDLHTGSFYRTNLPQLRANLNNSDVIELTKDFDAIAVLHSEGALGTLRRAAVDAGVPAVTLEAGGPMELNEDYVAQGVKAINTLLDKRGMLDTISFWGAPQPTFYSSVWVRVNQGGILFSDIKLGARVRKGDLLGKVTDPITNIRSLITSPAQGRIIGMAVNQVVLPGFAAYHIGIDPTTIDPKSIVPPEDGEGAQDNDEEEEASFDEFD